MCGIAGVFDTRGAPIDSTLVTKMARTMAHRGPDGEGVFTAKNVGLGHRRLAIIDLSNAADQPMSNEDGSVVIVFNGEIYNFQELRAQLTAKGHVFHSRSDTEVIVHGYEQWGKAVVEHLNGMFAFAVWDREGDCLFIARDRYGIKPLYYAIEDGRFIFASEIKSILEVSAWSGDVDQRALVEYFTFQNVLSDRTLFADIRMFPAAHTGVVRSGSDNVVSQRYWDYGFGATPEIEIGIEEAASLLRERMTQAVTRQLVSDVPLGSYLSGGMDSGSLVALASLSIPHLMTFTGGFDVSLATGIEQNFDERESAEFMAREFQSDHYEMVLHAGSMQRVLPKLIWHLEDLRVGMSYQNYYIAHLASKFVRVCLSGGGGDEMFAGYPWRYLPLLATESADEFDRTSYRVWQRLVRDSDHRDFFSDDVRAAARGYEPYDVFREVLAPMRSRDGAWNAHAALDREMYLEARTFLHGLLVVEDKISSAHALEARVPFLDNELVDFAMTLPAHLKLNIAALRGGGPSASGAAVESNDGKFVLRQAMTGVVPDSILNKKKQGFSTPDASWYRGDTMDYIKEIVLSPRALARGYFQPAFVHRVIDEHSRGTVNHRLLIWSLLSFEWWNRVFADRESELV